MTDYGGNSEGAGRPIEGKGTVVVSSRIPEKLAEKMGEIAAQKGISKNELLRRLIIEKYS